MDRLTALKSINARYDAALSGHTKIDAWYRAGKATRSDWDRSAGRLARAEELRSIVAALPADATVTIYENGQVSITR